jgi:hypothetical protein
MPHNDSGRLLSQRCCIVHIQAISEIFTKVFGRFVVLSNSNHQHPCHGAERQTCFDFA